MMPYAAVSLSLFAANTLLDMLSAYVMLRFADDNMPMPAAAAAAAITLPLIAAITLLMLDAAAMLFYMPFFFATLLLPRHDATPPLPLLPDAATLP